MPFTLAYKPRTEAERRQILPPGECPMCDRIRDLATSFGVPAHDPSPRCTSGGVRHCGCVRCF